MFGYVVIHKSEMKVKDFEIYNAIYCGLCRKMGKTYGPFSKFCLNYDLTFVSLLQAALTDECDGYEQKCCRVNPFKKCTYCKNDDGFQELAAAAGVVLCDMKLEDNITDGSFFPALLYRFLRIFTKSWSKKAFENFPLLKTIISEYKEEQCLAESDENCSLDKAAEPTAKALSRILAMIETEEKYRFVLERIGYCLGKWTYLCDAADDIEKDIKSGNFNPLKSELDGKTQAKKQAEARLIPLMNNCFVECANYSELLDYKKYKPIVDNILHEGLKNRQQKIFKEEKKG